MKKDIVEKLSTLVTAAFGLVAALAWNSAIQSIFITIFGENSSVSAMISYAIIVTIIAVFVTIWIGNVSNKAEK